jgi:hypothetical protein
MYIQATINNVNRALNMIPLTYKIMFNSMLIAVSCETLGHLLLHEVNGVVLLEAQAGEVVIDSCRLHRCVVQGVLAALASNLGCRASLSFGLVQIGQRWRIPELNHLNS